MRTLLKLLACNQIWNLSDLREHTNLITQFIGIEDQVVEIVYQVLKCVSLGKMFSLKILT